MRGQPRSEAARRDIADLEGVHRGRGDDQARNPRRDDRHGGQIGRGADLLGDAHRSPLFGEILRPTLAGAKKALKSAHAEIFVFPSTGAGGLETVISNMLFPGDKLLAARNGMFSRRWIDMRQRHGLEVQIVEQAWGEGLPADRFEEILAADKGHEIKAVLATHDETATGVRSDIAAVRRALDAAKHPALLFVDGVNSIASMDFRMDEWGVDVAGSQIGTGLGDVAGKVFRIGRLGSLTDVMALAGLSTAKMTLVDLGLPIRLGSGVAAAQEHYRQSACAALKPAA